MTQSQSLWTAFLWSSDSIRCLCIQRRLYCLSRRTQSGFGRWRSWDIKRSSHKTLEQLTLLDQFAVVQWCTGSHRSSASICKSILCLSTRLPCQRTLDRRFCRFLSFCFLKISFSEPLYVEPIATLTWHVKLNTTTSFQSGVAQAFLNAIVFGVDFEKVKRFLVFQVAQSSRIKFCIWNFSVHRKWHHLATS